MGRTLSLYSWQDSWRNEITFPAPEVKGVLWTCHTLLKSRPHQEQLSVGQRAVDVNYVSRMIFDLSELVGEKKDTGWFLCHPQTGLIPSHTNVRWGKEAPHVKLWIMKQKDGVFCFCFWRERNWPSDWEWHQVSRLSGGAVKSSPWCRQLWSHEGSRKATENTLRI